MQQTICNETAPALLAVSFGTSYAETRHATIGAIEQALQEAWSDYQVRRAFTSPTIIRKLRQRDGIEIDNVSQALQRLAEDGVSRVLVQPTHMMPGFEYDDLKKEARAFSDSFDSLVIGEPLLRTQEDLLCLARILKEKTSRFEAPDRAVIWMGHGTEHPANAIYGQMQRAFDAIGCTRQLVGTVEGTPDLSDMIEAAKALGVAKVVLQPMMIVAGDHASNDMAGDAEDSWKNQFKQAGFQVECVLEGIGQYPEVHQMIVSHARKALESV